MEKTWSLVRSSWLFFRPNWKLLVPILAFPELLFAAGRALSATKNDVLVILSIVFLIGGWIVYILAYPTVVTGVHNLSSGAPVSGTLGARYKASSKYFWWYVFLAVISCFVFFGSFTLFIVPGIIMSIYVAMTMFTMVLEDKKGLAMFTESYSLIKDRWGQVFVRLLVLGLLCVIFSVIVGFIVGLLLGIFNIWSPSIAQPIVSLITGSLIGPFSVIYTYKLYLDLKNTRTALVQTKNFKGWLVAFLIIGIISAAALITLGIVAYNLQSY